MEEDIDVQKTGYLELIDICVAESRRPELIEFINSIEEDYNGDGEFHTTLNFVRTHLDQTDFHFIMGLDWKSEIENLVWRIGSALKDNFNLIVDLPQPSSYEEGASVSFKNVFMDFDNALRLHHFQLGFIDTNSDEYVIIVHLVKDEQAAAVAVNNLGYEYLDANLIHQQNQ